MATTNENKKFIQLITTNNFIGKGNFGEVHGPCVWEDKICVVKRRSCGKLDKCKKEYEACKKWMSLRHRNLVTVYDVSFESPALFILMEYGSGGSLRSVLDRCTSALPEQILTDWSIQIARGMAYLHRKMIVHRDLKSLNIIVMEPDAATNPCGKTLKIIDFDQIREHDQTASMSSAGTAAWTAPEVLEFNSFSKSSDVYSYGVVLWELTTREVPYQEHKVKGPAIAISVINKTYRLTVPDLCPEDIKTVMESCLLYEKEKRKTFSDILSALKDTQSQELEMSTEGEDSGSSESITNISMKSVNAPVTKDIMQKTNKPSRQISKDDSGLDDRRTDKHARGTIFGKMKHLFSRSGSIRNKTAMIAEALPANKGNDAIERHREFLEEHIEPDFGLLEKLLSNGTLSRKQILEVKDKSPFYKRNSQLLDYIVTSHQDDRLIEALRDTEQIHIVNYLNGNGEYKPEYGEEWPLTKSEISILDANEDSLIDLLDLSTLLSLLYAAKVINKRQMDLISSKPTSQNKIEVLLDILHRRSLRDYQQMISCLRLSNQIHIADVFEKGGVVMRVHAHLDGPLEHVTESEDEISTALASTLIGTSIEERSRIWGLTQLKLIGAKKGQSIVLYIWCETEEELRRLYEFLMNGRLKDSAEQLFNQLLAPTQNVVVKDIIMNDDEFDRLKACFTDIESMHSVAKSEMEPMEVEMTPAPESETLTSMCTIFRVYEEHQHLPQSGMEVEVTPVTESEDPAAVQESLETEGGKKPGLPGSMEEESLTGEDINAAILRNNTDFFQQHIRRLRGLINKLHAKDILSDEDTRYIKTLDHESEKIDEILNVIRNSSSENYDTFVSFLRESGQTMVADVAAKGGVVLKIKVTHEYTENSEEIEKQIVEKLNQLQDKTVRKSEEVWQYLSQLKRGNIEIVSSQWEKGVVVWCWCRSWSALQTLDALSRSDMKQPNLLSGLFNLLLPGKNTLTINSVYLENHEDELVCRGHRSIDSKHSGPTGKRQAFGVAIIQAKICLLCQSPNAIVVYEDAESTKPSEELPLDDVVTPMDMAYSKESNCLYITDKGTATVWRIAFPSPENKVDRWLDSAAADPFTLSITSNGRLVMVKRGPPSCLEIYLPDSQLLLHLDLPTPILKPNHAVETSKGTLVVSYNQDVGVRGGICEITKEGQIISRLDSMFESINGVEMYVNELLGRLTKSKCINFDYLAIDDKDQVYACDSMNSELAVLDSRLMLLKGGIAGPKATHRVQFFKEQMQLMVL